MKRNSLQAWMRSLSEIYNLHDEYAKGRVISLGSGLMTAFYNVFITGIFYTGFLSLYDISITGVGIISFIPAISNCFSVFSSVILEKFQKRKAILIISKIYFYAMYILATTLMPQFVTDPDARLVWFVVILFLAHSVYALFSPGFTPWFYFFYPVDNETRTRYITYNQIFTSIMSSVVLLVSGVLTDAVAGSPYQKQLILGLRYFAFVLVLIDVFMQAQAKEYPYIIGQKLHFRQVFTLPFRYKKFIRCLALMFYWSFVSNLNGGVWGYHLLNHLNLSYTLMNVMAVLGTFILIFTSRFWRKMLYRYSWIKTFGICNLVWVPTEFMFFLLTTKTSFLFIPATLFQSVLGVGIGLSYANVLYMNLPEENTMAHIAFQSIGCNLFSFLGAMLGTKISSLTGDATVTVLGLEFYSVQLTTLMRAVTMLALGLFATKYWRIFTRDQDIAEIEERELMRKA